MEDNVVVATTLTERKLARSYMGGGEKPLRVVPPDSPVRAVLFSHAAAHLEKIASPSNKAVKKSCETIAPISARYTKDSVGGAGVGMELSDVVMKVKGVAASEIGVQEAKYEDRNEQSTPRLSKAAVLDMLYSKIQSMDKLRVETSEFLMRETRVDVDPLAMGLGKGARGGVIHSSNNPAAKFPESTREIIESVLESQASSAHAFEEFREEIVRGGPHLVQTQGKQHTDAGVASIRRVSETAAKLVTSDMLSLVRFFCHIMPVLIISEIIQSDTRTHIYKRICALSRNI